MKPTTDQTARPEAAKAALARAVREFQDSPPEVAAIRTALLQDSVESISQLLADETTRQMVFMHGALSFYRQACPTDPAKAKRRAETLLLELELINPK